MKHSQNPSFFFLLEVDWTEPWLLGLVAFHALITLTTIVTRHNGNIQGVLFLTLLVLIYCSEALNEIAARNWKSFSRQQYFDSNGMFISTVFSVPLLLNCIIMVGQWMWSSGNLMIQLKRKQLKLAMKQENGGGNVIANDTEKIVRRRYSSTSKSQ